MIDLSKLSIAKLAAAYNGLATVLELASVNKFSDRATGEKRVLGLVEKLTAAGKVVKISEDGVAAITEPKPVAAPEPGKPAGKKPEPGKRGQGRPPSYADSDRIIILVAKNPKKGPAAARYALYKEGMTVAEYIAAVATLDQPVDARQQALRDLTWDTKPGQRFVRVVGTKSYAKIAAERDAKAAEAKAGEPKEDEAKAA